MGTSLSGLTPATTFDGLLKTSDNDALGTGLKTIGTGDGTDSVLQLSNSQLNVAGQFTVDTDTTATTMNLRGDGLNINQVYQANNTTYNTISMINSAGIQFKNLANTVAVIRSDKFGLGIGGSTIPSATAHIKGSGATSATTSLLVQNSAGSELFKVQDDGRVDFASLFALGTNIYGTNSSFRINIASSNEYSTFDGHIFKTYDGAAYTEAMRITGNTSQFVGIGETTPTARLHVKGSGNTNTTTSLLVQNSDAADILKVTDDGGAILKSFGAINTLVVDSSAGTSSLEMQSTGAQRFRIQASSTSTRFTPNNTGGLTFVGNGIFTGGAFDTAAARLHIKGSGATSATTALLVQNSAGTDLLEVRDDGVLKLLNGKAIRYGGIEAFNGNSSSGEIRIAEHSGFTNTIITSKLSVIGTGNTSATTALLVQNSAGTDLLKVRDDGWIEGISTLNSTSVRVTGNLQVGGTNFKVDNTNTYLQSQFTNNVFGGVNTDGDASALVTMKSTTQGFLPPRMTTAQKTAITAPAAGLMVYDTDQNQMNYYNGTGWIAI